MAAEDRSARLNALHMALDFWPEGTDADEVLKTAEKFFEFLTKDSPPRPVGQSYRRSDDYHYPI